MQRDSTTAGGLRSGPRPAGRGLQEAAELLARRAGRTSDPEAARDLVAVALELDPECPAALLAVVDQGSVPTGQRRAVLRRALRGLVRRGREGGRRDSRLLVDILAGLREDAGRRQEV